MRKLVSYKSSIIVFALAIALFFAGQTDAQVFAEGLNGNGPEVRIGEDGMPWAEAIKSGMIRPVGPKGVLTSAAEQFYRDQVKLDPNVSEFALVDIELTPDVPRVPDRSGESHTAMIMSWPDFARFDPSFLGIGAWDLVYDPGVSLKGMKIHFSILPVDVWDVSLELIDVNGNSRGWFIYGPAPFWANAWIDPSIQAVQPPFTNYFGDPGFDISQVVTIRLDESWMGNSLSTDVDPTTGEFNPWNAWDHLRVEPIPPRPICDITLEIVPRTDGQFDWNFVLWDPWQDVWWETWIVIHDIGIFPLWRLPIPPIPEEMPFEISIPIPLPPLGRVAVLTALSTPDMGLGCGDIAIVDTGRPTTGGSLSAGEIQESLSAIKPSMSR